MIEIFNFISEIFGQLLFTLAGLIAVIIGISTYITEQKTIKMGVLIEATCIGSSIFKKKDSAPTIVPKFNFLFNERLYTIEGKTNSKVKIGQKTPIYINPDKPDKEYYMPKKDFLMKYFCIFIGCFFMYLGGLSILKHLGMYKDIYFLYLFIGLFVCTFILYLIGRIIDK